MNSENEISMHEAEMLKRLEARYSMANSTIEESPFRHLPIINKAVIRGTHFLAYRNDDADFQESPVIFYSEKNRFFQICRSLMTDWWQDLDQLIHLLTLSEQQDSYDLELSQFGLQVSHDCYIYSYGGSTPIFASKDLLVSILEFAIDSAKIVFENSMVGMIALADQEIKKLRLAISETDET
ncbi:MAG: hypothetical protein H3C43_03420 [Leptonema sp. (in: Bacteria)]|nr:hypothetical protein [Leptonema sp. (in: bacteria)]